MIDHAVFDCPDGKITLISWEYVMNKLEEELTDTLAYLKDNNTQLGRIETRLDEWLEEQSS